MPSSPDKNEVIAKTNTGFEKALAKSCATDCLPATLWYHSLMIAEAEF